MNFQKHSILFGWGQPPLPPKYIQNILLAKEHSPDHQICLWINPEYFSTPTPAPVAELSWGEGKSKPTGQDPFSAYDPLAEWQEYLQSRGVVLKNYQTDLDQHSEFQDLLAVVDGMHLDKPVVSADILRAIILYQQGGIYSDTDTEIKVDLGKLKLRAPGGIILEASNISAMCNNFMACEPDSFVIKKILAQMQINVLDKPKEVIMRWAKNDVLDNTGPGVFVNLATHDEDIRHGHTHSKPLFDNIVFCGLDWLAINHTYDSTWRDPKEPGMEGKREHFEGANIRARAALLWGACTAAPLIPEPWVEPPEKLDLSCMRP